MYSPYDIKLYTIKSSHPNFGGRRECEQTLVFFI